jgi:hypothetical protein
MDPPQFLLHAGQEHGQKRFGRQWSGSNKTVGRQNRFRHGIKFARIGLEPPSVHGHSHSSVPVIADDVWKAKQLISRQKTGIVAIPLQFPFLLV